MSDCTPTVEWINSIVEAAQDILSTAPKEIVIGGELHSALRDLDIRIWQIRDNVIEDVYRD